MLALSCFKGINGLRKKSAVGWDNKFKRMLVAFVMVHPAERPAHAEYLLAQVVRAYGCQTAGESYAANRSRQSVTLNQRDRADTPCMMRTHLSRPTSSPTSAGLF